MEALKIEILNPKAKRILQSLEELNLIRISKPSESSKDVKQLLARLRSKKNVELSINEITTEVEEARAERYGKKNK
jgi:biotin synthase-related radical SAM superfamily protein